MSYFNDLFNLSNVNATTSIVYLDFTQQVLDVPQLIGNLSFTNSLGCYNGSEALLCNETCGDVTDVLLNWPNFYTCSWYPSLSQTIDTANLTASEITTLGSLGILGAQQGLAENISSTIAHCLADYCQSSTECVSLDTDGYCSLENLLNTNGSTNTLNRANAFSCMRVGVCSSTTNVNPDIGGLGVIISLIIQYTISLLGLLIHGVFYLRYKLAKRRIRRSSTPDREKRILQAGKNLDHHLEPLTSALVEFQKSQCFFAATLQIAALIVIPSELNQVRTRDQVLLNLTAANAFSPIMLTLAHIDFLGGRNSWYLLILSGITFALGTAAYWDSSPTLSGSSLQSIIYTNPAVPLMSCGNMAPYAPCYVQNEFYENELWPMLEGLLYILPEKTGLAVWVVSFIMFLYQTTSKGLDIEENRPRVAAHIRTFCEDIKAIRDILISKIASFRIGQRLLQFVMRLSTGLRLLSIYQKIRDAICKEDSWKYSQLILGTAALMIQLITVVDVLVNSSNIISTEMSFGQIVAVGIWIPVLLEYGYLEIYGAAEGTEYRLKHPLVVTTAPTVGGSGQAVTTNATGATSSP